MRTQGGIQRASITRHDCAHRPHVEPTDYFRQPVPPRVGLGGVGLGGMGLMGDGWRWTWREKPNNGAL